MDAKFELREPYSYLELYEVYWKRKWSTKH